LAYDPARLFGLANWQPWMAKRAAREQKFDLFIPRMNSLPLKDQREITERAFFSSRGR